MTLLHPDPEVAADLRKDGYDAISEHRAATQDIRPLDIGILNLMPGEVRKNTEGQLARLLTANPLQTRLHLVRVGSHTPRFEDARLQQFYRTLEVVRTQGLDGLIITGAPVETIPFEEVRYWPELVAIMDWAREYVPCVLHLCWGAQAGLYHHYGIEKHLLPDGKKLTGIFPHTKVSKTDPLLRGMNDRVWLPHSRYTTSDEAAITAHPQLEQLITSEQAGTYLVSSKDRSLMFASGHIEYATPTLKEEYARDCQKVADGKLDTAPLPQNYFPDDDPDNEPENRWRADASILFRNWMEQVYLAASPHPTPNRKWQERPEDGV